MAYSTWEAYSGGYGGALPEEMYKKYAPRAAAEIDAKTHGRAHESVGMEEKLCGCECALIDGMHAYGGADGLLPRGIASASSDGFSARRGGEGEGAAYREICLRYLTSPQNLMWRAL